MPAPVKFFICGKNALDLATVTTTATAATGMPVTNVQLSARGRVFRTTTDAAFDLKFTWNGTAYPMNFLNLYRHNLENNATWRVIVYPNADWTGTPLYDSTAIDAYDSPTFGDLEWGVQPLGTSIFDAFLGLRWSKVYFGSTVQAKSVKITITDTGNSADYIQIGRVFAGEGTELTYPPESVNLKWDEGTSQLRSSGGSLRSDSEIAYRVLEVSFPFLTDAQRSEILDTIRYAGMRSDIFVDVFPADATKLGRDHCMIARLTKMPDMNWAFKGMFKTAFSLGEI